MSTPAPPAFSFAKLFPRRRVLFTLAVVLPLGLSARPVIAVADVVVVARGLLVGLFAMLAYGVFEQWPARLPARLERWVLQLVAVVIAVPVGALVAYWITIGGDPQFGQNPAAAERLSEPDRARGLFAPWIALGAMVRRRRRSRAIRRSRSSSNAASSSARHSTRACVCCRRRSQPHFLFNTLANVQALVDAGSPQASARAARA